ncbi:MAG: hypothetical protein WAZ75_02690 [Candidatus Absconditicoccaceae bacterium]
MNELKVFIADTKGKTLSFLLELIGLILEVFNAQNFTDSEKQIKDGETVLREMSRSEKAIFSLSNTLIEILKSKESEQEVLLSGDNIIIEENCDCPICTMMPLLMGIKPEREKTCYPKDSMHPDWLKMLELDKDIKHLNAQIQALDRFFWDSIKADLPEETQDYDDLAVRTGFQIVAYNEQAEPETQE